MFTLYLIFSVRRRLFDHQITLGRFHIEFAEEVVPSWLQRTDKDHRLAAPGDDFLAVEIETLEFLGGEIEIFHQQLDLGGGGNRYLRGLEFMVLDKNFEHRCFGGSGQGRHQAETKQNRPRKE